MPKHKDDYFNDLGFTFIREENAYKACCILCDRKLTNTGMRRLRSHRNYCTLNGILPIRQKNRMLDKNDDEAATLLEIVEEISGHPSALPVVIDMDDDDSADLVNVVVPEDENATVCVVEPPAQSAIEPPLESTVHASGARANGANRPARANKASKAPSQRDQTKLLDEKLSDFVFGCDIPPAVVESAHFRNLIAALRPSYASHLPTRQRLATQLLDAASERCAAEHRRRLRDQPSVLVVDEWQRGEYGPCNVLVALLRNAGVGDDRVLVGARHATDDDDRHVYAQFVRHSLEAAQRLYQTTVYAVVGDRATEMDAQAPFDAVWRSPCYLGLANALAQDLFDQELDEKVTFVLRQFKRAAWHRALTKAGGQPVPLPRCDSWRSYHESYAHLVRNAPFMKAAVESAFEADDAQRQLTRDLLAEAHFVESVEQHAHALEPVCRLIETCGRSDAGLADAAHAWLEARVEAPFSEAFERRRSAALTEYALAAYFLHPKRVYYERSTRMARATHDEDRRHFVTAQRFLLERLDADGIEAFDNFQNEAGIAKTLLAKNVQNATVFWRMVKPHHPQMAELALRLLRIPASASRVDRQFYRRSYAHDALAAVADDEAATFERCEKLLRVYYSRRSADIASPEF